MRYTLAAALDQVLTSFESKGGKNEGGGGDRVAAASVAVPMGHPPAAQGDLSCPAMGGGARRSSAGAEGSNGGGAGAAAVKLSPQLFAAMDVDERTAVVHRYLPPALLDYVETALQVRCRGEGRRRDGTASAVNGCGGRGGTTRRRR